MSLAKLILLLVGLVFASTACGALERSATDARAADVVVSKNDPPASCRPIGEVTGDVVIGSLESAKQDLVRNAAEGGGNYVAVDMTERHPGGYGMVGRLFQCPERRDADRDRALPRRRPSPSGRRALTIEADGQRQERQERPAIRTSLAFLARWRDARHYARPP